MKKIITAKVIFIGMLEECEEAIEVLERKKQKKISEIVEVEYGCSKVKF